MIQGRYAVRRNGDDDDDDDGGGGVANRHEVAASLVSSSEARAAAAAAIRTGGEHKCKRTFTYVLLWRMSAKDNTVSSVTARLTPAEQRMPQPHPHRTSEAGISNSRRILPLPSSSSNSHRNAVRDGVREGSLFRGNTEGFCRTELLTLLQ